MTTGRSQLVFRFAVLWLAGNCLRLSILAVPPLLPRIHHDLRMSETLVGALTSLPVLLLALGAVWGSLLVSRLGARRALLVGLTLVAGAGAARGLGPATPVLFAATLVMGMGVALAQPTFPSLVRHWVPQHSASGTALYANGILVGEILPASLTLPVVIPLLGGGWERALAFWSIPVALVVVLIATRTPHEAPDPEDEPPGWWPDWRSGRTWRLGLILGCAGASYFGANAFVPDYLKATHHAAVIPVALTSLNLAQFPSSLLVAFAPRQMVAQRTPIVLAGAVGLGATLLFAMGGAWVAVWAGVLGFSTALVFVLGLALPPLLAEPRDLHRLVAAMFTIAYACPFTASLMGGAIWDVTGVPLLAFAPVAAAGLCMMLLVLGLDLRPAARALQDPARRPRGA